MPKKLLSKKVWKDALGAAKKPKRLHLVPDKDGLFNCPVDLCDSDSFHTKRGCRKHVFQRHGWYYYFEEKPNINAVLPTQTTVALHEKFRKTKRSRTNDMPTFSKDCLFDRNFKAWLCSPVGGLKSSTQSTQISCRLSKYLKFCCQDCCSSWDIPLKVIDYCIGSVSSISDFISYLKETWNVGNAGIIGYMNSISHVLDYRRVGEGDVCQSLVASEIYIERVKKTFAKKCVLSGISCLVLSTFQKLTAGLPLKRCKM